MSRRDMETVSSNLRRISLKLVQKTDGSWILWLHKIHLDPGEGFLLLHGLVSARAGQTGKQRRRKFQRLIYKKPPQRKIGSL